MAIYNVMDFGAVADGQTSCTSAFEKTIGACEKNGGGTVFVPAGQYSTGAIFLKSNMNFYVEAGATICFASDINEYPVVKSRWEGVLRDCYASCINADDAENVTISGGGTLDGQGAFWWQLFREKKNEYPRPKLIAPYNCTNVLIRDVTLKNSPSWTVNPILCKQVTVDNIKIFNPSDSPNTDGVNPESSQNIHISNCHIDVGDDCIAIKAGTEDTAERVSCENITITNCTMVHGHGGVVLGSEMSGSIRNVTISNCIFEGTDRGIRLKSRRGRGGVVEDLRVNNIVMKNVICPFIANLYYFCGPKGDDKYVWDKAPYPITEETPSFRRLHFANITAREVSAAAGYFYGLPEMVVEDVTFDNVYITMAEDAEPGYPAMLANIEPVKQKGFFISNAKDFIFNNVTVAGHDGPAFEVENSADMVFKNCKAKNPIGSDVVVQANNVSNCDII